MSEMPRVQAVTLPILKDAGLTVDTDDFGLVSVTVNSWVPDIDYREFPILQVRRVGGFRSVRFPKRLALPVIEMTAYTAAVNGGDLPATEQLYEDALEVLFDAVRKQTQTDAGYLHSIKETFGATQFGSLFQDSWRVQGLIQLGVRPPRSA